MTRYPNVYGYLSTHSSLIGLIILGYPLMKLWRRNDRPDKHIRLHRGKQVCSANLILQLLSANLIQLIKLNLLARLTDASLEAAIGVRMCHEHGHGRRHDARRDRPAANP